jgi:hypothetical protein
VAPLPRGRFVSACSDATAHVRTSVVNMQIMR